MPCHRLKHSAFGGLFQPTLNQAIRLLSSQPYSSAAAHAGGASSQSPSSGVSDDPFSAGALTYTTNGTDSIPSPSVYRSNRHSWVHVFPEGLVHQHPQVDLRYFKWGVARLILESEPAPDIVPMFIDGTQKIMPEHRTFPRFLPRFGKPVRVAFGDVVDFEATFGDLRRRWQGLVARKALEGNAANAGAVATAGQQQQQQQSPPINIPGELPDSLKFDDEANEIRIEVARRMREEVLKLRTATGRYPDSDPTYGLASTWAKDKENESKKYKSQVDGSEINQD